MSILTDSGVQALQRALDFITTHPNEWDQTTWTSFIDPSGERTNDPAAVLSGSCGTRACLAGWIVWLDPDTATITTFLEDGHEYADTYCVKYQGSNWTIPDLARKILTGGPDYDHETDGLFYSENSLHTLWAKAQGLAEGRLTVPEEFLS